MKKDVNQQYLKKLPAAFVLLILSFAGALFLFSFIVHEVFWDREEEFDRHLTQYISYHIETLDLTVFMKGITYFASPAFILMAYIFFIAVLLLMKKARRAVEIGTIGISGFLVTFVLKEIFRRIRPDNPLDKILFESLLQFSFPSGHASLGFILYGTMVYLIWKSKLPSLYKYIVATVLILFSLLIGFSRIYLRVHYATDVIAGFCLGYVWLTFAVWIFEHLKKKSVSQLPPEYHEYINTPPSAL